MNQPSAKPSVGFIGLGIMGGSMASRIQAAGYPLHVYARTRAKAETLLSAGALWHDTPASLARACDIVITIVGMPDDVRGLYLGAQGLIAQAKPGAVLVDMTTSSPALAIELAQAGSARGVKVLDAPVSGGDVGAREGRLSIMVGGDEQALAIAEPVLRCLGANIALMGGPGAGQHTKLCNQTVIASTMLGLCEGLAYAKRAGLDLEKVLGVVGGGAASSFLWNGLGPRIARGDYAAGFFVEHLIKDMRLASEEAGAMGQDLPGLAVARCLYQELADAGYGRLGTQALFTVYDGTDKDGKA